MKALIALDGSAESDHVLAMAQELLAGKPTEVIVFHVLPRHYIYGKGGPVVAECYDPDEARKASQDLLTKAATQLRAAGVGATISQEIQVGDPADAILSLAAAEELDLIIMGSRGLNAAQRFLLGSVSTKVSAHAPCAVLVAYPKVAKAPGESEPMRAAAAI